MSTLQFSLFKIKIIRKRSKCLRLETSTKTLLALCKGDNTTKKNIS